MREGATFEQVKQIYLQIKELEYYVNVQQWQGSTKSTQQLQGRGGERDQFTS